MQNSIFHFPDTFHDALSDETMPYHTRQQDSSRDPMWRTSFPAMDILQTIPQPPQQENLTSTLLIKHVI